MKAYKFPVKLTADGQLELLSELWEYLRDQSRNQSTVRVIVLIDENDA